MSDSAQDYKDVLTKTIQKLIVILGPDITLLKVRNIPGITVSDDGTVTALSGDQEKIQQQLHDQLAELSGTLANKTLNNSQLTVDHNV